MAFIGTLTCLSVVSFALGACLAHTAANLSEYQRRFGPHMTIALLFLTLGLVCFIISAILYFLAS